MYLNFFKIIILSFIDLYENAIILSKYIPDEHKIQSEKVILNDENTDENTPFL